jgi:hypothetical protein
MSKNTFSLKKHEKNGFKICHITSGINKHKYIYIIEDDSGKDFIVCPRSKIILSQNSDRITMFICGESGLGKSTYASDIANEYHKNFKKNTIVLISPKDQDDAYDNIPVLKISLNEENFLDNDTKLNLKELENTMVIMDDIESILDKDIKQSINNLKDAIYTQGRSTNISIIFICHKCTDNNNTKTALFESKYIVFGPKSTLRYQIDNMLEKYVGLNRDQKKKIMNIPSRLILLSRNYPSYVLGDDCIFFV